MSDEKRYRFLLGQSRLFEYFIDARRLGKSPLDALTRQSIDTDESMVEEEDDKRHHRKTEREEDAELLAETVEEAPSFVFTESPAFVEGGPLRPYQIQGLNWLISLYDHGINGILADEMGLGKTLQTLSFLGYLKTFRGINGPFLMVVPKSTLQNWMNEVARWIPKFRAFCLHGDRDERQRIIREWLSNHGDDDDASSPWDICVTSYEMCLIEKAAIRRITWEYLVIDEAHRIKNEHSMLSQIVRGFTSKGRLLITGTPLQNNLHELWALLNYLLPDVFSSPEDFDSWFRQHGETDQEQMLGHLKALLQPFLLRRLKQDVEHSLLPKKEVNLYVGMSDMQRAWYRRILERDIEAVNGLTRGRREGTTRLLNIVMQLRKACNHPYLFDGAEPGPPYTTDQHLVDNAGKMIVLDQLLARLQTAGSRVLLFSQMSRMLDIFEDYCQWKSLPYCRIDGQTPHEERIAAIDDFNRPGSDRFVFLLTTRAGGLGINLATADAVILYDSDWNPQVDLQAQDRAHRIGQTRQVVVFRLLTEQSIEEKIIERAMQKLRLDQLVIQQGRLSGTVKPPGREEMLAMIRHGAEAVLSSSSSGGKMATAAIGDSTKADIEEILARGEQRTKELREKYRNTGFEDLLAGGAESGSMYEWEGADYNQQQQTLAPRRFIELAKRERSQANYQVDSYYREALRVAPAKERPARAPVPKSCIIHDYQFFPSVEELKALLDRTVLCHQRALGYRLTELDIADPDERRRRQRLIDGAEPLTPREEQRKQELLAQGFPNWHKKDFYAFVRCLERHGRKAGIEAAAGETGKPMEEVRQYSKAFWANLHSLPDGAKIRAGVERGEHRLERAAAVQRCLVDFVRTNPASQCLRLNYYGSKSRNFTPDEDEFIVRALADIGYAPPALPGQHGGWDVYEEIGRRAHSNPLFRFDWFMRTRTPQDLAGRAARLVSFVERDMATRGGRINKSGGGGGGKRRRKGRRDGGSGA